MQVYEYVIVEKEHGRGGCPANNGVNRDVSEVLTRGEIIAHSEAAAREIINRHEVTTAMQQGTEGEVKSEDVEVLIRPFC